MLYLIYVQAITVGQFFSLFIYSFFIFGPLQELGNIINIYREAEVSLKNFQEILEMKKEPRPLNPVQLPELRHLAFSHVSFQHQTASSPALTDISFSLKRGDTIAFVGPSGAGKTTLVKLLVGLYRPKSGDILYNGHFSSDVDLNQLRERIGFVTQDTQLFSGTIRENLLFVNPKATDAECLDVLHKASCDSLLARASKGLDTVIGEGGVKVSGGERQRLSIARALLRRPHLLVFDEATSSLDSLTEDEIGQTIRRGGNEPRRHDDSDRPPAVDHHARRSDLRAGAGQHHGIRHARAAARRKGAVLRDVAPADRREADRTRRDCAAEDSARLMATSSRIRAADAAFAAVEHFYSSSRYGERRFDPGISDFTFGNPHELPLPGPCRGNSRARPAARQELVCLQDERRGAASVPGRARRPRAGPAVRPRGHRAHDWCLRRHHGGLSPGSGCRRRSDLF